MLYDVEFINEDCEPEWECGLSEEEVINKSIRYGVIWELRRCRAC